MSDKQRVFGQFDTPPDVADLILGFCLRRPSDRLLDPSCGVGAFLQRARQWQRWLAGTAVVPDTLYGIELDNEQARAARETLPHILNQNFFTLSPAAFDHSPFDAIIGNPPYTRAEWIGRLNEEAGRQLSIFEADETERGGSVTVPEPLIPQHLWSQMDGRSGLYAYFFLHSVPFLREGGRLGFVVPNGWLDVGYGHRLKQFLLAHFKVLALIESGVERWFDTAKVNTCIVVLEKCNGAQRRARNMVRLVRLKRPLRTLIACGQHDPQRPAMVERLIVRLLPGHTHRTDELAIRVVLQETLAPTDKWGLVLRSPDVYRRQIEANQLPPLRTWATVQRGFTTGANHFFYLSREAVDKWGVEPQFRQPLLKSLRGIADLRLSRAHSQVEVLMVPPTADLRRTAVQEYIAWGEANGIHQRHSCAARQPWYSLPLQSPPQVILPKGIWRRHTAPLLQDELLVDQQLYQILIPDEMSPITVAALLNSAWTALQCELHGRLNFGAGVLWLATYELGSLRLPDPRHLSTAQTNLLETAFTQLAQRPIHAIEDELNQPDRQALDTAVFDILGFSSADRTAVLDALLERVQTRRRRAGMTG